MNLLRFDSDAAWTNAVCALWKDRLQNNPRLRMCLPSGLTPIDAYREMQRSVAAGHVSFAQASIFVLDEFGGVAQDDSGRTVNTLRRQLVAGLDLPEHALNFLDPDADDLDAECSRYDRAIGDGFDLVVLGIGTNGHVGMNEPGSAADSGTRRVDLEQATIRASARYFEHRNLPRWGLTVGMKQILASREIWLLAKGGSKAAILSRALNGAVAADLPASLLQPHRNCSAFLDAAAAALL